MGFSQLWSGGNFSYKILATTDPMFFLISFIIGALELEGTGVDVTVFMNLAVPNLHPLLDGL